MPAAASRNTRLTFRFPALVRTLVRLPATPRRWPALSLRHSLFAIAIVARLSFAPGRVAGSISGHYRVLDWTAGARVSEAVRLVRTAASCVAV